jgi:peptidoglycan glycosyltransferase
MDDQRVTARKGSLVSLFVVVLALLLTGLAVASWLPLRRAREEWRQGRVAAAIEEAQRWSRLPLWPNQYREVLAASHLSIGGRARARQHLEAVRGKRLWFRALPKSEVAERLFARGRYDDFLLYDDAVRHLWRGDEALLYRAAALTAMNRLADAEGALKDADRDDFDPRRLSSLERAIAQRKEGSFPYVFDRQGKVIAVYQVANQDVVAINTDFASLIEKEAGAMTIEAHAKNLGVDAIVTTLDPALQKAAITALGGFRGAIVAIDPRTNEILAAASTRGRGASENLALEHQYEPGSVIKVLTGLSALAAGIDVQAMFPYLCAGELPIDGRSFGDWLPGGHGTLPDLEEAMAQSCNIVFADIGVRLGRDRLRQTLLAAGFNGQTNLRLFSVPLGRLVGGIHDDYETAYTAIGLEHQTATALHLAMLAAAMANRGRLTQPLLVTGRRSLLGDEIAVDRRQGSAEIAPRAHAERLIQTMVAVVTRPAGTGRRAPIAGVTLAMKTGTAGRREDGYHATIIAFAPVEQPRIAFAVVAEDSGPAEFAGAKIVRDFLEAVRGRL